MNMHYFVCTWVIEECKLGAILQSFFLADKLGCHQILLDIPLDWWEIQGLISVDIAIRVPSLEVFEEYKRRTVYRTHLIDWKPISAGTYEKALTQDFNEEHIRHEKYAKAFYYFANKNKVRRIDSELASIPVTQLNMNFSEEDIAFLEKNDMQSLAKIPFRFIIVDKHEKQLWQKIFIQMQEDGFYNLENVVLEPEKAGQQLSVRQIKFVAEHQTKFTYDFFTNDDYWDIGIQIEDSHALMSTNFFEGDEDAPLRFFMLCGDWKAIKVLVQEIANHYGTYSCMFGTKTDPIIFVPEK